MALEKLAGGGERGRCRQRLKLGEGASEYKLKPGEALRCEKTKEVKEDYISQVTSRLNDIFITVNLTDKDLLCDAYIIRKKTVKMNR